MEYLQYFNAEDVKAEIARVLNLIINGIPSIHNYDFVIEDLNKVGF